MKILLLHDVQADKQNGVSVSLGILYNMLKKTENEVRILTLSDGTRSYKNGDHYCLSSVPALIYPGIRMRPPINNKYVEELIEWNPDIIHTNCEFSTFLYADQIHKRCKVTPKWVHTFHTDYKYYIGVFQNVKTIRDKAVPKVLNKCFTKADALIVPTVKMRDYVINAPIFSDRINMKIIPTGIDFSELEQNPDESVLNTKKELGIPADAKIILFLGRISQEKNLSELLKYFKEYIKEHDDVYLVTVGSGPYMDTLKSKASDPGFNGRVIVHDGVPHREIRKYYDVADVFASASMSETQGLTFYEALHCGVPVIAKDRECLEGAFEEGVNGAFFDDYATFEDALDSVIDLKANADESSEPKLPKCFESETFARSVEELYRELLEGSKKEADVLPKKGNISFKAFKKKININFEIGGKKKK